MQGLEYESGDVLTQIEIRETFTPEKFRLCNHLLHLKLVKHNKNLTKNVYIWKFSYANPKDMHIILLMIWPTTT